jgi:hypothetical protein
MELFTDPDGLTAPGGEALPAVRPFPYARCQTVTVRGVTTTSGRRPRISPNLELEQGAVVIE